MDETWWLSAGARVAADLEGDTRDEAVEVFTAEAARCRLADRRGRAIVHLMGGHVLEGRLRPDAAVADHLWIEGRGEAVVAVTAIRVMTGSRGSLRDEHPRRERTLASVLRERWSTAEPLRALSCDGSVRGGVLEFVGADHADLRTPSGVVTLPFPAVAAWLLD